MDGSSDSGAQPRNPFRIVGAAARAPRPGSAPDADGRRRSVALTILAGMTAVYMTFALAFGVDYAIRFSSNTAFLVMAGVLLLLALWTQIRLSAGVAVVMALSFVLQMNWAAATDPQPIDDLARLIDSARRLSAGFAAGSVEWRFLEQSQSPAALLIYSLAILALGDDLSLVRIVASGLWLVQIWLVWRIAREVADLRDRAALAAAVFGLSPTLIVYGPLPSVEAVFGVFALGAIYAILSHRRRGLMLSIAIGGALASLAFLARPMGAGVMLGLALSTTVGVLIARGWRDRLRVGATVGALALGFGLGLAPQILLNVTQQGVVSAAPGPAIGYQMLIGSNQAGGGRFNEAISSVDLREAGFIGEDRLPLREADNRAIGIALDRIASDPLSFFVFTVTEKIRRMWSNQREMLVWGLNGVSLGAAPFGDGVTDTPTSAVTRAPQSAARAIVDGFHLAFLAAVSLAAWRLCVTRGQAVREPTRWVLIYAVLTSMGFIGAFLEARPRQHMTITPFLAITAPLAFAGRRRITALDGVLGKVRAPKVGGLRRARAKPANVEDGSAEAKIATVLSKMSKPPRPDRDERS